MARAKQAPVAKPVAFAEKRAPGAVRDAKPPRSQLPPGKSRLTCNIDTELHKRIKREAVEREVTVTELVEELIARHIP